MRTFDEAGFDRAFADLVSRNRWQERPEHYLRYRSRYEAIMRRFAERAPDRPVDVLDIGGGQLAFLAVALWGDRGRVADIDDTCLASLRAHGIEAFQWNLALEDPRSHRRFDAIFISEVITHLPGPGHIALRRLRMLLRRGGMLFCSSPNRYRLRNASYLLRGRPPFDHFDVPGVRSYGPVVDYSAEHLAWQFEKGASSIARSTWRTSRTCRMRRWTGCCPRSAPRCAGFPATGTTCSPSAPRPRLRLGGESTPRHSVQVNRLHSGRCGWRLPSAKVRQLLQHLHQLAATVVEPPTPSRRCKAARGDNRQVAAAPRRLAANRLGGWQRDNGDKSAASGTRAEVK